MRLVTGDARLIDTATGRSLGGTALASAIDEAAASLVAPAGVVFVLLPAQLDAVTRYLGALAAGRAVLPLDPETPRLHELVARFAPALVSGVTGAPPEGYDATEDAWVRRAPSHEPHPELAVLLTTSGSTGNPKLVRLSRAAVLANARSIGAALEITASDVAVTSLPLFYSYGLSVLHSHLVRGATVVLSQRTILEKPFWRDVAAHAVTSLAGVPHQYQVLHRMGFEPAQHPTLRTLTQAGGRLAPELVAAFHQRMAAVGGRLFVMYGQTEAGPRMTTLASLPAKLGCVGPAIPGGALAIETADGETTAPGITGEVIYRGPNVMMGYAETAADLARADDCGGRLATGDLGHLDDDGHLWLTGRIKRIGKVFGVRIQLDDAERALTSVPPAAVIAGDDRLIVFVETEDPSWRAHVTAALSAELHVHARGIEVRIIDRLPRLANGKIDYQELASRAS
jgi:acyl-CoA synthetase (AMP-forming)/AMP-acid ligase II